LKKIKVGTVLILCESPSDSFVEIQESFVQRLWMLDIQMKIGNSAQTATDSIVERT
jgi:hypothetical protein